MNAASKPIFVISLLIAACLLAACGTAPSLPAATAVSTPTPNETLTPTAILAGLSETAQPEMESTATRVPHDTTPLRFTFPTPAPAPGSQWRPPLYDIPFALGPYDHFYFARPIAADQVNWPLADYRYGYVFPKTESVHTGVDIDAPRGTPVVAAGDGKVIWAGFGLLNYNDDSSDPYGMAVAIRHNFGYQGRHITTVYAHMDRVDVVVGQQVRVGDQLGIVGNTGNTTGPHLHFEVRLETNTYFATRNPELWLAPPEGWGVLVGRLLNTNGSLLSIQDVKVTNLDTKNEYTIRTYAPRLVFSDDYYQENMVLSDLPAGKYQITIDYLDSIYRYRVSIHPGAITFFNFRGERGFNANPPPTPDPLSWMPPP